MSAISIGAFRQFHPPHEKTKTPQPSRNTNFAVLDFYQSTQACTRISFKELLSTDGLLSGQKMSEPAKQCTKRKSPLKLVAPPVKKERTDDNTVQMTLQSKRILGNLELIWCERDAEQDGFTQPLATDLLSNDSQSFTSRNGVFMHGSRRKNTCGGVQLNRETTCPRRFCVRLLGEHETTEERLSVLRDICKARNERRDSFHCGKEPLVSYFLSSWCHCCFNLHVVSSKQGRPRFGQERVGQARHRVAECSFCCNKLGLQSDQSGKS